MGTDEIWLATILSFILFLYLLFAKKTNNKKLQKLPPGPKALPLIGHFHLLGKLPHRSLQALAKKHGPIMYLKLGSAPVVVVSSPATAELALKTHDVNFASRPPHQAAVYHQMSITSTPYGPYWRYMRRLSTTELLNEEKIDQFESMRKEQLDIFIEQIKQAAQKGQEVNLSELNCAIGADMISLMVFGRKYAEEDMSQEIGFKALFNEMMELGGRFIISDYFPYLKPFDLQGIARRVKNLRATLDPFLDKIIEDRVSSKKNNPGVDYHDFLETMMAIMESGEAGFQYDRGHIKAVLLDMLIGGLDTTPTAVEWIMSELLRHPRVMKKLQQELEEVVGFDHMVEESHLHRLEYLDLVVKEGLRLHPVAPLLLPHAALEDTTVQGFHVPKGSRIITNVWAVGRDPDVWTDPDEFIPERFIGSKVDLRGRDFQLLPFGSGRRGCPGLQLGLLQVNLVVSQLVHCFAWKLPTGMLPENLDMTENPGLVTARVNHLILTPTYRLHK